MSTSSDKVDIENREDLQSVPTPATSLERDEVAALSQEHRDYLIRKHGSLDIDPVPAFGDADPYNWPNWKKIANLVLVAWHACMSFFTGAAIIPAYADIAEDLGVSIQQASYLTALQIAILGVAPLFWRPLSDRFGRRYIFLISLIISLVGNIGCARSPSYATMSICRAIVAFGICPPVALGGAVVSETFFKRDRAKYMGVWTVMITLGVPTAPFIFGFVAYHANYRWIYWILAIINGCQLVLYIFLGPETRYLRKGIGKEDSDLSQEYFMLRRIDPKPLNAAEFAAPLKLCTFPTVSIPGVAYGIIFLFANVMISVEIPQLFVPKFGFNPQQLGLQFLGIIVGSLIGEQFGGLASDYWMQRRSRKTHEPPHPGHRLWLSYLGFLLATLGTVLFLTLTAKAPENQWNVGPIIGSGIAAAGNQIVTTILITYAVDCHTDRASSVGALINLIRQILGFVGPFWFPDMFTSLGLGGSAGLAAGIILVMSIVPIMLLHWKGERWR